jgi:hypothetical protein
MTRGVSTHRVDLTGDYETTIYDAARRLLAGSASDVRGENSPPKKPPQGDGDFSRGENSPGDDDTIETWRGGVLSMTGKIGECAKWTVEFRSTGPCLVPHRGVGTARLAAEMAGPPCPGRRLLMAARPRLADRGASLAPWVKGRPWRARIYIAGKDTHLGYFASSGEACAAHADAVKEHLGEQFLKSRGSAGA